MFFQLSGRLMTFNEAKDDLTDRIDFIVCLGGDGTLLYASSLFQKSVPPVMAFHLVSFPLIVFNPVNSNTWNEINLTPSELFLHYRDP